MELSRRVQEVRPSPTLAIQAQAKALKAKGEKVFSLAAGEPDFPTPEPIQSAAVEAMRAGHTGYAPSAGVPALREAIRRLIENSWGVPYGDDQVVVSCGAKQCIYNAFQALLDPGAEAIIQAPYWVSYPEQVRLCGARPVIVSPPASGFGLNVPAMADAVTGQTRVVVVNSPCNPTGHLLGDEDLDQVCELAERHDLTVISDDIYDRLVFDGRKFSNVVLRNRSMQDRTLVVNGVSKTYAMTGWRLGWALGPAGLISAMRKVQDQSTSNATTFVQHAAVAALASPPELVDRMVETFDRRRRFVVEALSAIEGVSCELPTGTFYAFPSFASVVGRSHKGERIESTLHLAELLLEHQRVAVVPGEAFGAPGHLRISFAAADDDLREALERVGRFVQGLG